MLISASWLKHVKGTVLILQATSALESATEALLYRLLQQQCSVYVSVGASQMIALDKARSLPLTWGGSFQILLDLLCEKGAVCTHVFKVTRRGQ